jgi:predicted HTH domain antitoxin
MQITVQLPDDIAQLPNPGRVALEALAIAGYRAGTLSHCQASQLLGMGRIEFDCFLKEKNLIEYACDVEDFEEDLQIMRQIRSAGLVR